MVTRKRPPGVSDSISAWGSKWSDHVSVETRMPPFSPWTDVHIRTIIDKRKVHSTNAILVNGWRSPTFFRAYTCRYSPGPPFIYQGKESGYLTTHIGERGFPPLVDDIYLGVSGAGRYPLTSDNLVNRATVECMNKLKDSDMNLGETLASMNQTLAMIANSALTLRNLVLALRGKTRKLTKRWDNAKDELRRVNSVRRKAGKPPIKHSEYMRRRNLPVRRPSQTTLANSWLELQYGWIPLLNDISSFMELVNRGNVALPVRAVRHITEQHALPVHIPNGQAPFNLSYKGKIESGAIVRIDADVRHPMLAQLDALGLINPLALAWELIPYSFVIDWILPIGNCLKALSTFVGLELRSVSTTRYTKADIGVEWYMLKEASGVPISARIGSLSTDRVPSFTWPFPVPYWKSPFTTATRAATALALLLQLR